MPIRLNLLAEAQAAEDLRRRDPVKRCLWIAALLVSLMLVWSSSIQLKGMMVKREVSRSENQMKTFTNDFEQVLANRKKIEEIKYKLASLQQLTTNRFLQATALNALQQTVVDDVQLLHFKTQHAYSLTDEVKPRTNDTRVIAGKPATVTEKILVSLEGSDSSANPGDQVPRFKTAVANNPYFKNLLGKPDGVSLKNLSPPDLSANGKRSVAFTLECRIPEVTR
jgi:hypothetical protein